MSDVDVNGNAKKDYTHRPNVKRFLPWWREFVKKNDTPPGKGRGLNHAIEVLRKGKTKFLDHKDRLGLMQALADED
jgi:hypothetical protein